MFGHSSSEVSRYLLDRAGKNRMALSPMKLIKLVYIAHGWMLGLYGRPLIVEYVEAWRYGPVIPELYRKVKQFRSKPVRADVFSKLDADKFDQYEEGVMDEVLDIYGKRTAIQLSQLTHSQNTPWDQTCNSDSRSLVISDQLIENYYAQLYEEYTKQ